MQNEKSKKASIERVRVSVFLRFWIQHSAFCILHFDLRRVYQRNSFADPALRRGPASDEGPLRTEN
jgi:hypothetical protein